MGDEGSHFHFAVFYEAKRTRVDRRFAVGFKSAGCPDRGDKSRFLEHHAVQYAQVDACMPMSVEKHCRLFADERWNRGEDLTLSRGFDQILDTPAGRAI